MGKSMQIEKQELIERINEIDDIKVLEKLRKILFTRTEVKEAEPCTFSNEDVKAILDKQRKERRPRIANSDVMNVVGQW